MFKITSSHELIKKLSNKQNEKVVLEFLLSLKLANYSEITIYRYRLFLEHFFIHQEKTFSDLTSEQILNWFQQHQGHVQARTYKSRLSILSAFYTFCVQEEYLKQNLVKSYWFPRTTKTTPRYLEKEEIARINVAIEKLPLRDQALVELMRESGCRVGEVHGLNIEDVDLENRTVTVLGKGRKIREGHFSDKCALLFERYIEQRKGHKSNAFFLTFTTNKRLSKKQINTIVKELGEKAKVEGLTPHRFRHTFATELLSKGADLSFISEELGHSDLRTTKIYANLPQREIVAMYRKFMG